MLPYFGGWGALQAFFVYCLLLGVSHFVSIVPFTVVLLIRGNLLLVVMGLKIVCDLFSAVNCMFSFFQQYFIEVFLISHKRIKTDNWIR